MMLRSKSGRSLSFFLFSPFLLLLLFPHHASSSIYRRNYTPYGDLAGDRIRNVNTSSLSEASWMLLPSPNFYMDRDKGRMIVSLCQLSQEETQESPVRLEAASCPEGYKVTEYKKMVAGLGVSLNFFFSHVGLATGLFSASVGITPVKGSYVRRDRFIPSLEEIYHPYPFRIPYEASALKDWSIGDHLSYKTSGGLLTFATLWYSVVNAGITYLAQGEWMVDITKVDEDKVLVQVTKGTLKSLTASIGAVVSSLNISKFSQTDDAFSYQLDLTDPYAQKAYGDLLRGHLLPVQEAILKKSHPSIQFVSKHHTFSSTRRRKAQLAFPFIVYKDWDKGTTFTDSKTYQVNDQETLHGYYHIFYKQTYRQSMHGRYNKHVFTSQSFSANHLTHSKDQEVTESQQVGIFQWTYTNDYSERDQFQEAMSDLSQFVGHLPSVQVKAPLLKNLGYTGIFLTMTMPEEAIRKLQQQVKQSRMDPSAVLHSFPALREAMERFEDARTKGHRVEANRAFMDFGRQLVQSPHAFRSILKALNTSLQFQFKVEGEKFSQLHRQMNGLAFLSPLL